MAGSRISFYTYSPFARLISFQRLYQAYFWTSEPFLVALRRFKCILRLVINVQGYGFLVDAPPYDSEIASGLSVPSVADPGLDTIEDQWVRTLPVRPLTDVYLHHSWDAASGVSGQFSKGYGYQGQGRLGHWTHRSGDSLERTSNVVDNENLRRVLEPSPTILTHQAKLTPVA